jgi:hypothetical protein
MVEDTASAYLELLAKTSMGQRRANILKSK